MARMLESGPSTAILSGSYDFVFDSTGPDPRQLFRLEAQFSRERRREEN